jgi:hypothetical protein
MYQCLRCGAWLYPNTPQCPRCGVLQFKPARPANLAKITAIVVVVGIIMLGGLLSLMSQGPQPTGPGGASQSTSSQGAFLVCRDFVTQRLKAPKSADFAPMAESIVRSDMNGVYRVSSHVDSQNGFGAMIRTAYACTVEPVKGTNRWTLIRLDIDQ